VNAAAGSSSGWTKGWGLSGRGAFQWWLDELVGIVPPLLRRVLAGPDDIVALSFEDDKITLARSAGEVWLTLGSVEAAGEPARQRAGELIGGFVAADGIVAFLPAERAVMRRITLPLAVEAELDRALAFEIERHTPFPAGQACYFHEIIERNRRAGTLSVEVTVVARELVERATDAASRLGLAPTVVTVAAAVDAVEPTASAIERRNLLRAVDESARNPSLSRRRRVLLLIFALALVAAALSPLLRLRLALDDVQSRVPEARERAEAVLALETRIAALEREVALVSAARETAPSTVMLLEALSGALPDDTWLTSLNLSGERLVIEGRSSSAAALVRRLEMTRGFGRVEFGAPVTRSVSDGLEHFQLVVAMPTIARRSWSP